MLQIKKMAIVLSVIVSDLGMRGAQTSFKLSVSKKLLVYANNIKLGKTIGEGMYKDAFGWRSFPRFVAGFRNEAVKQSRLFFASKY